MPENTELKGLEVVRDYPCVGRQRAVLDAQRIEQEGDRPNLILLSIREMSDV
ncbi:MAG: hypothetical protein ACQESR_17745 [Planctomycetota bacterium]